MDNAKDAAYNSLVQQYVYQASHSYASTFELFLHSLGATRDNVAEWSLLREASGALEDVVTVTRNGSPVGTIKIVCDGLSFRVECKEVRNG